MARSFTKPPAEQYPIAVEFSAALPLDAVITTATLSAIDLADGSDVTGTLLENTFGNVNGTQVSTFVMGGENQHTYRVRFTVSLAPGDPPPVLVDDVILIVYDGAEAEV